VPRAACGVLLAAEGLLAYKQMRAIHAVLCGLSASYVHATLAPWCLLAGVGRYGGQGVSAAVVEGTVNEDIGAVAERIIAHRPDVLGLSCYLWNIRPHRELIRRLKERLPGCLVVLGGPEVSFRAAGYLAELPLADYILSGEGEYPFAALLNALASGEDVRATPGITYREGGTVVCRPAYRHTDTPPSPYTPTFFEALGGRICYMESSRGCPFRCAFCLSGREEGVVFFDETQARQTLLSLAQSGTRTVKFVDRTFNADRERARRMFEFVIREYGRAIPRGVCVHFEMAADLLDEDTLALLAEAPAGAIQFEIGIQSCHAPTLRAIGRHTDLAAAERNIRRLVAGGNIHVHVDLIAGLPYEGYETFADSFNRCYAWGAHRLQFGFLKLLYGTEIEAKKSAYVTKFDPYPPYQVLETPWLSAAELERLGAVAHLFDRLSNSGRFRRTLAYVLGQTEWQPFALFEDAARHLADPGIRTADALSDSFYRYALTLPGVEAAHLRDRMVCDRLASNAQGILSPALRQPERRLKAFRLHLDSHPATRRKASVRRGVEWLSGEGAFVWADYELPHPVTGEYELHIQRSPL